MLCRYAGIHSLIDAQAGAALLDPGPRLAGCVLVGGGLRESWKDTEVVRDFLRSVHRVILRDTRIFLCDLPPRSQEP